jgi:hypothetical protein
VDGTGSESCPVSAFGISNSETLGSATHVVCCLTKCIKNF